MPSKLRKDKRGTIKRQRKTKTIRKTRKLMHGGSSILSKIWPFGKKYAEITGPNNTKLDSTDASSVESNSNKSNNCKDDCYLVIKIKKGEEVDTILTINKKFLDTPEGKIFYDNIISEEKDVRENVNKQKDSLFSLTYPNLIKKKHRYLSKRTEKFDEFLNKLELIKNGDATNDMEFILNLDTSNRATYKNYEENFLYLKFFSN